ncbi:MAG: 2Fe-2S iron-sulfur cluster-binding protein [Bacteroidota bacterium]|nr:2Fe-2S iron-sulfur cluster-binding protein [Bacteroidota bacterium]
MINEINIKVIDRNGELHNLKGPIDMNLNVMELLKINELPVEGTCGGMAMCASCHVYVVSDHILPEKTFDETAMLEESWDMQDNSRLSCQLKLSEQLEGLTIQIAPEQ